ncbi:MAG: tRNA(His) guanylyltransferase Thg1 family protein [bacterium]
MKDELGRRMKEYYENRTRIYLPRRTYTIIRIDGKAFHSYTKGLTRPFDDGLIQDMDDTAIHLCENIQGAKLAFVQSDEISILLTDFDKIGTDAWFDGNVQKICSVSASLATSKFNQLRLKRNAELIINRVEDFINSFKLANFDSRTFTIPSKTEVMNYFIWRQQDTVRNSISSVAQSLYSHKELNGKNTDQMQEMCFQKGFNWNDLNSKLKRGRFIEKIEYNKELENGEKVIRTKWVSNECPTFTQDVDFIDKRIPNN